MQNLLQDILNIITSFTLIDYILYFSVITLIILVVSLIYIIQNEKTLKEQNNLKEEKINEDLDEELDLENIINTIDENPKPLIDMTAYEEEQEQKAIISYEELLNGKNKDRLNYEQEELVDNVIPVKKVQIKTLDDNEILNSFQLLEKEPKIEVDIRSDSHLFMYEKEEEFLKALKTLNELLNEG